MEYNSMIKKTDKQKKARAKGRKHKKQKLGQIIYLENVIKKKDQEIFKLNERIKSLEGELLLYK